MIREYSQKNSVIHLAFIIAELTPIDQDVIDYAIKEEPITFANMVSIKPTTEFHKYLQQVRIKMARRLQKKSINNTLYN